MHVSLGNKLPKAISTQQKSIATSNEHGVVQHGGTQFAVVAQAASQAIAVFVVANVVSADVTGINNL